jgi:hypothetical protein
MTGIFIYDGSSNRKKVQKLFVYDGSSNRKAVLRGFIYDGSSNRKLFFSSSQAASEFFPYSAPYGAPGTGGNGVTFSTPPCTFAAQGTLTFSNGTPLGTTVIMAHITKQSGASGNNDCYLVVNTAGPHSTIQGRRLALNGTLCTLAGNPASAFNYIGAGFGGFYYVTGAFDNAQSYLSAAPSNHIFSIRDA